MRPSWGRFDVRALVHVGRRRGLVQPSEALDFRRKAVDVKLMRLVGPRERQVNHVAGTPRRADALPDV